jgi:hypothetical protein
MKPPTLKQAILYHCWQCLGFYSDGKRDCKNPRCPLYSFMPYRDKKTDPCLWFMEFSPRRCGKKPPVKVELTPEKLEALRKAMRDRFKKDASGARK